MRREALQWKKVPEPFVVGAMVAPLGAAVGTVLMIVFVAIIYPMPAGSAGSFLFLSVLIGMVLGALYALPLTWIALPLTYLLLKRLNRLTPSIFMTVGTVGAIFSVLGANKLQSLLKGSSLESGSALIIPLFGRIDLWLVLTCLIAIIAGLVSAWAYVHSMRRLWPADWNGSPPASIGV